MAKTLSLTGILEGQTVEAHHVSQSIVALTGQDAYDIEISGSLTVSGSLLVNGIPSSNKSAILNVDTQTGEVGYILTSSLFDTGSLLTTSSYNSTTNTITYTKGNGSQYNIVLNTGSTSGDTGSLLTTSSFDASTGIITVTKGNGSSYTHNIGISASYYQVGIHTGSANYQTQSISDTPTGIQLGTGNVVRVTDLQPGQSYYQAHYTVEYGRLLTQSGNITSGIKAELVDGTGTTVETSVFRHMDEFTGGDQYDIYKTVSVTVPRFEPRDGTLTLYVTRIGNTLTGSLHITAANLVVQKIT